MFTRVWPTGITNNTPAGGPQLTQLDINVASKLLDGGAGGKVSPTSIIKVSGAGLQISENADDAAFVTTGAKWLGAVMDLRPVDSTFSNFAIRQFDDISGQTDGLLVAVDGSANASLRLSTDGGASWQLPSPLTGFGANSFGCCAGSSSGAAIGAGVTIFGGTNGQCRYADLATSAFSTSLGLVASTLTLPGSPTRIDRIVYDQVHNQFVAIGATAGAPYLCTITNATIPVATQRTVPAAITGSNVGLSISQNPVTGRMIATWANQTKIAYSDDGITWTASTSALAGGFLLAWGDGVFIALSVTTSGAFVSTDGSTWSTSGVTRPGGASIFPSSRGFAACNGCLVVGYDTGTLYFSVDRGATWVASQSLIRTTSHGFSRIGAIVARDGRLYVGASDPSGSAASYITRSTRL